MNINHKKVEVIPYCQEKVNFGTIHFTSKINEYLLRIKLKIDQEDITTQYLYVPYKRSSEYVRTVTERN